MCHPTQHGRDPPGPCTCACGTGRGPIQRCTFDREPGPPPFGWSVRAGTVAPDPGDARQPRGGHVERTGTTSRPCADPRPTGWIHALTPRRPGCAGPSPRPVPDARPVDPETMVDHRPTGRRILRLVPGVRSRPWPRPRRYPPHHDDPSVPPPFTASADRPAPAPHIPSTHPLERRQEIDRVPSGAQGLGPGTPTGGSLSLPPRGIRTGNHRLTPVDSRFLRACSSVRPGPDRTAGASSSPVDDPPPSDPPPSDPPPSDPRPIDEHT